MTRIRMTLGATAVAVAAVLAVGMAAPAGAAPAAPSVRPIGCC